MISEIVPVVVHMTSAENKNVQMGSARYQYDIPLGSSQRSWNAQINAAERHTPKLCTTSPITCAIAAFTARLRSSSVSAVSSQPPPS